MDGNRINCFQNGSHTMNTCFVMQPFDGDVYDKRYEDVFAPAIKDAGLEPYRVDRDPKVSIPIQDIELGIRNALICFAEITTDNPNVWFELGFAIAAAREVVLVCSEDRKSHFPFDIQHRSIIKYRTGAPQDYAKLKEQITKRIFALLKKKEEISEAATISPVKDTKGLAQHEVVALVTVMENSFIYGGLVPAQTIRRDMNKAGFTDIAVSLAMKVLRKKDMILASEGHNEDDGTPFDVYGMATQGEEWLLANQNQLKLVKDKEPPAKPDIPF